MSKTLTALCAALAAWTSLAAFEKGAWKIDFDESTGSLKLDYSAKKVTLDGRLRFVSNGKDWKVVASRDAARDRLALANPGGTVLGYVSFRDLAGRLEITVLHRAGANFFPGRLAYDGVADFRADSFACRTIPMPGEQILNFADGAGDSPVNDSVFAREEDLALRFFSDATSVRTKEAGKYAFRIEADIDDSALATMAVEVDGAYYASRWAPGYHPIDRKRCPRALTGWMSWNIYFDKAGAAENLAEARVGAKYLKPFGLDIWSIESWQDNSLWLPVSTFHHHANRCYPAQFPEGMKKLADDIRALGFKPGIWMSLYGEGDDAFYQAHRDLYLHDRNGQPINNWAGKYMLDTTNPDALALMKKLANQARREWGYEFFKFDGMANTPRKFERPEIRACAKNPNDTKWFENSVRALREGIGEDALFLGCMGDFTGTEVRFVDASRLGSDVVGCYRGLEKKAYPGGEREDAFCQMPVKWKNVLHQAECTFTQIFVNNIMFFTDPDTLMVNYSLEENEARVMATIVGLPGQLMFAGDKLAELRMDRMKIIQQVLPVADIHPQNLYPYAASAMLPIWNLSVTRPFGTYRVVAVFNFTDAPKTYEIPLCELGLACDKPYTFFEFWGQKWEGVRQGALSLDVPMRTVRLFAIWDALDRPQFVGDDRHITQGAVELDSLAWDAAAKTYTTGIKVVGGFPLKYHVRMPAPFSFVGVDQPAGAKAKAEVNGEIVTVTLEAPRTSDLKVTLRFR